MIPFTRSRKTEAVLPFPAADATVVLRTLPDGTKVSVAYSLVDDGRVYVRLDGHWAENAANFTGARALFQGTRERTFTPEQPMTSGMLATVLYRLDGAPSVGKTAFSNVERGGWYADGVAWVSENSIAGGGRRSRLTCRVRFFLRLQPLAANASNAASSHSSTRFQYSPVARDALAFTWVESVVTSRPLTSPAITHWRTTSWKSRRKTLRKLGFCRRSCEIVLWSGTGLSMFNPKYHRNGIRSR